MFHARTVSSRDKVVRFKSEFVSRSDVAIYRVPLGDALGAPRRD